MTISHNKKGLINTKTSKKKQQQKLNITCRGAQSDGQACQISQQLKWGGVPYP